jgi:hypothetical protein
MVLFPGTACQSSVSIRHMGLGRGLAALIVIHSRVSCEMKQRAIQILYSYWNELRAGRMAPRRLEIEPSRIAGILAETFMLERNDANNFQFRLAGTRLCEIFGSELRGTNFLAGWSERDRCILEHELATTCSQGAVCALTIEASADGQHRLELEVILLPLLHSADTIGRIIGAMSANSTPQWLTSERLVTRRLLRHQLIWPDGRPHSVVERAGLQSPFVPAAPDARQSRSDRPQLRVVEGGRAQPKLEDR